MNKIFVIGSMQNSKEIEFSARALNTIEDNSVRYAKPIDEINTLSDAIEEAFNNIEWCDALYVVKKEDGSIGSGTLYELTYARRLRKEIYFLN